MGTIVTASPLTMLQPRIFWNLLHCLPHTQIAQNILRPTKQRIEPNSPMIMFHMSSHPRSSDPSPSKDLRCILRSELGATRAVHLEEGNLPC